MNKKFGLIFCLYDCEENVDRVLQPFLEASLDHHFVFTIVHGQFREYEELGYQDSDQGTIDNISKYNDAVHFIYNKPYDQHLNEAEIRNQGLRYCLGEGVDYVWMIDGDEFYTTEQINRIISYVYSNPLITWFPIHLKNIIFDGTQWIDGFCPPRIFKSETNTHVLDSFYWDNDLYYREKSPPSISSQIKKISYKEFASLPVPRGVAHILHETWTHKNGKKKYEYQMKHFGHCGYRWNYDTNQLEFDEDYYTRVGLPMPKPLSL